MKMLVLFLISLISISSCAFLENECSYGEHIPDPQDCRVFYHCSLNSVPKSCGFLMFNPEKQICDWPTKVMQIRPECRFEEKLGFDLHTDLTRDNSISRHKTVRMLNLLQRPESRTIELNAKSHQTQPGFFRQNSVTQKQPFHNQEVYEKPTVEGIANIVSVPGEASFTASNSNDFGAILTQRIKEEITRKLLDHQQKLTESGEQPPLIAEAQQHVAEVPVQVASQAPPPPPQLFLRPAVPLLRPVKPNSLLSQFPEQSHMPAQQHLSEGRLPFTQPVVLLPQVKLVHSGIPTGGQAPPLHSFRQFSQVGDAGSSSGVSSSFSAGSGDSSSGSGDSSSVNSGSGVPSTVFLQPVRPISLTTAPPAFTPVSQQLHSAVKPTVLRETFHVSSGRVGSRLELSSDSTVAPHSPSTDASPTSSLAPSSPPAPSPSPVQSLSPVPTSPLSFAPVSEVPILNTRAESETTIDPLISDEDITLAAALVAEEDAQDKEAVEEVATEANRITQGTARRLGVTRDFRINPLRALKINRPRTLRKNIHFSDKKAILERRNNLRVVGFTKIPDSVTESVSSELLQEPETAFRSRPTNLFLRSESRTKPANRNDNSIVEVTKLEPIRLTQKDPSSLTRESPPEEDRVRLVDLPLNGREGIRGITLKQAANSALNKTENVYFEEVEDGPEESGSPAAVPWPFGNSQFWSQNDQGQFSLERISGGSKQPVITTSQEKSIVRVISSQGETSQSLLSMIPTAS